jgi:hypothetical protein
MNLSKLELFWVNRVFGCASSPLQFDITGIRSLAKLGCVYGLLDNFLQSALWPVRFL